MEAFLDSRQRSLNHLIMNNVMSNYFNNLYLLVAILVSMIIHLILLILTDLTLNHKVYLSPPSDIEISFVNSTPKKLKEKFGLSILGQIVEHSNAYLVHSNDGKTIITMGKYLNQ